MERRGDRRLLALEDLSGKNPPHIKKIHKEIEETKYYGPFFTRFVFQCLTSRKVTLMAD
jgi:hypothetical protein